MFIHSVGRYTRAIRKVPSSEVLTKQGTRKKCNTTNSYIRVLQLHPNIASVGNEALISGSKLCMAVSKSAVYELSHVLIPSISSSTVEALWSQPVLHLGQQVLAARSEIRAVRRVVKQLPVEMIQQCLSANSCMRARIVVDEHYTECQHSDPFPLNGRPCAFINFSQYTSDVKVRCCMNSTVSTSFLSQKQLPSAFWETFV
jgi:hypothetical protein